MGYVFLNGEFVEDDKAFISVFDQGLLYGDGIFETFRSIGGRFYKFPHHYQRLLTSADSLGYHITVSQAELEVILSELQQRNGLIDAYFRITVTRGKGQVGFQRNYSGSDLTWLVIAKPFKALDEKLYRDGIELVVAQTRRNAPEAINPKVKSISNLNSLLGKLEAKKAGTLEVIMLNTKQFLCECSASNIFWVKDNRFVFTPDASTGLLEGVTRSTIMQLCEKLGLRVITGEFKFQDLKFADEVFITSTSLEVMPVVKISGFIINRGEVGPVSQHLREELHRDMNKDAKEGAF